MGIGDMLDSTMKTPVTSASYSLGSAAFTKINNTVRGGGRENRVDEKLMKESHSEVVVAVGKETIMSSGEEREMGEPSVVSGSAVAGAKTPVSKVLKSSYSLGSAAVSKVDNVVKGGANRVEKLKNYMPGPEQKMVRVITHPATKEVLKFVVPPAAVGAYNVAATVLKNQSSTNNVHDNNKFEKALKVLRDENDKMRAELEHMKEQLNECHGRLKYFLDERS